MTKEERIKRLNEIHAELGDIANSFAGEETGYYAVELHRVTNSLRKVILKFDTGFTETDKNLQIQQWLLDKTLEQIEAM